MRLWTSVTPKYNIARTATTPAQIKIFGRRLVVFFQTGALHRMLNRPLSADPSHDFRLASPICPTAQWRYLCLLFPKACT